MKLIVKILNSLSLQSKQILPPQKGYRNISYPIILKDGLKVNLIFYKNEKDIVQKIKVANYVSNYLASEGFPTRKSLSPIIKLSNKEVVRYACLYNYLPGETIPWEGYTMEHIKLLGMVLSNIHSSVRQITNYELRITNIVDEMLLYNKRTRKYFVDSQVAEAIERKLKLRIDFNTFDQFDKLLQELAKLPNQQVLHMDFVRGNILWKSEVLLISGILDFEKVAIGSIIIDIARTLAFLIVDCKYKSEAKVRKYFLVSGYKKRGKSEVRDIKYLESLLNFFWMYDFYKFLKHNPYEFLMENEHFVRTRDRLIERKILDIGL